MDHLRSLLEKEPTGIAALVMAAVPVIAARFELTGEEVSLISAGATIVLGWLLRRTVYSPATASALTAKDDGAGAQASIDGGIRADEFIDDQVARFESLGVDEPEEDDDEA